jgi:hypothetical protein
MESAVEIEGAMTCWMLNVSLLVVTLLRSWTGHGSEASGRGDPPSSTKQKSAKKTEPWRDQLQRATAEPWRDQLRDRFDEASIAQALKAVVQRLQEEAWNRDQGKTLELSRCAGMMPGDLFYNEETGTIKQSRSSRYNNQKRSSNCIPNPKSDPGAASSTRVKFCNNCNGRAVAKKGQQ